MVAVKRNAYLTNISRSHISFFKSQERGEVSDIHCAGSINFSMEMAERGFGKALQGGSHEAEIAIVPHCCAIS